MVLTIPHDFEASLVRTGVGAGAAVGQRGEGIGRRHRAVVCVAHPRRLLDGADATLRPSAQRRRRQRAGPRAGVARIDVRARGWYNPTLNYQHYMVPGILVALVTHHRHAADGAEHRARERARHARAAQRDADHARRSSSPRNCCRSGCSAMIELAIGLLVGVTGLRRPDARQPAAALWRRGRVPGRRRSASACGSPRSWTRSSRRCSSRSSSMNVYLLMSGLFTPIDSMAPWVQTLSRAQSRAALRDHLARDADEGRRHRGDCASARAARRLRNGRPSIRDSSGTASARPDPGRPADSSLFRAARGSRHPHRTCSAFASASS